MRNASCIIALCCILDKATPIDASYSFASGFVPLQPAFFNLFSGTQ